MKYQLTAIACLLAYNVIFAQNEEIQVQPHPLPEILIDEGADEPDFFTIVEVMPEFPGGQDSLMRYLAAIPYPRVAKDSSWEGSTYIRFLINEEGEVITPSVVRSSKHAVLDSTAVAHIRSMPRWTPGTQRGKPVKVQYIVPFRFKLD